jgi:hypothetical protein
LKQHLLLSKNDANNSLRNHKSMLNHCVEASTKSRKSINSV